MPGTSGRPEVLGDMAHDAAETTTSFPVKVGGTAYDFDGTALPTAVAESDRTEARFTRDGRSLVEIGHPTFFQTFTAYAASTTNSSVVAAPGAGLSLYLTDVVVNAEGNALSGRLSFLDDLTSTGEKLRFRLGTNETSDHTFRQPIKLTANKPLGVTTDLTTTSFFIAGYIAP